MSNLFFKSNYVEPLKIITPDHYFQTDIDLSGLELDPIDEIINSHIEVATNIGSIFSISSIPAHPNMGNVSGIEKFFVKQNKITKIDPFGFEKDILKPLGESFGNYATKEDFKEFVETKLLPKIRLDNSDSNHLPSFTNAAYSSTASGTHEYLIDNLSWFYFLNTSADGGLAVEPSSIVSTAFSETLYNGKALEAADGIKALTEHMWNNYDVCSLFQTKKLIPTSYLSGTATYTSGTQQLDKLKTMVDVLYSSAYMDKDDTKVRDAFEDFINLNTFLNSFSSKGPFFKFLRALGFSFADLQNDANKLDLLYDIENAPTELLPLIADLIGWKFFGHDPVRWRLQLSNAVEIYKKLGTRKGIQTVIDSIFSKDIFGVENSINELWESYIPHLIYYALATESPLFSSLDKYTKDLSVSLNIDFHNSTSLDENLKLAVDNILLLLVKEFPDHFFIGDKVFPIDDPSFVFTYRGRIFGIPPFEEYLYYKDSRVSQPLINKIKQILTCTFQVSDDFADKLGNYLLKFTLQYKDNIHIGNEWLFFTSAVQTPPNQQEILGTTGGQNINLANKNRESYLSLWSGKSSHIRVIFESTDFDFSKNSLTADSAQALLQTSRVLKDFVPAHTIPEVLLVTNDTDDLESKEVNGMDINFDMPDFSVSHTEETSGVDMRSLSVSANFQRAEVDGVDACTGSRDLTDPLISSTASISAYRNAIRRRNYENFLNMESYYDRTGFNMPVNFEMIVQENSYTSSLGFLPLGFVPSAGVYQTTDTSTLHKVWDKCETLTSQNTFFDVPTSATYPARGLFNLNSNLKFHGSPGITSSVDHYNYRGFIPPLIRIMHQVLEDQAKARAEISISQVNNFGTSSIWMNTIQSLANSGINENGWIPSGIENYYNFSWGRDLHRLYEDYTNEMGRHPLTAKEDKLGGLDILAHTYGPLLFNGNFDIKGSVINALPQYIASSLDPTDLKVINEDSIEALGTTFTETNWDLGTEHINANILSGIEFVITDESSDKNDFSIYNIKPQNSLPITNPFINNPIIKARAVNKFPRIRFDLSGYGPTPNRFLPDHYFDIDLRTFISNQAGTEIGGGSVGIFIHTKAEGPNNLVWVFVPGKMKGEGQGAHWNFEGHWKLYKDSDITKDLIINTLSHVTTFPSKSVPPPPPEVLSCESENSLVDISNEQNLLFEHVSLRFNTVNLPLSVSNEYYTLFSENCTVSPQQVHRKDQQYVVEVFMLPNTLNEQKFMLLDYVSIVDIVELDRSQLKLNYWTGEVQGTPRKFELFVDKFCNGPKVLSLTKQQTVDIFKSFNKMADNRASRDKTKTETLFGPEGGSRLNYRTHPEWVGTPGSNNQITEIDIIN